MKRDKIIDILEEAKEYDVPFGITADAITEPVGEEEIKKAASEYEKIACCDKDHAFLKEYVNEDFTAGAEWMQEHYT